MNKKYLLAIALLAVLSAVFILFFTLINRTNSQYFEALPPIPNSLDETSSLKINLNQQYDLVKEDPSKDNIGELGMIYHANYFFEEAKICYLLASDRSSENWKWSYYLGCLNREMGKTDDAISNFKTVLNLSPKNYMAYYYMGEGFQQTNDYSKAIEIFRTISELDKNIFKHSNTLREFYFPLPIYAQLELSKIYISQNTNEVAEKEIRSLIDKQIDFGPAYRQLSILYAQLGKQDSSKYYSDRANDLNIYISPVDTLIDKLSYYSYSEDYLLKQIDDAIRSSNSRWALELIDHGLKHLPNSKFIKSKAIKQFIDMNTVAKAVPIINDHINAFQNNYAELTEVGNKFADFRHKNQAERYFSQILLIEDIDPDKKSELAGIFLEKLQMKDKSLEIINDILVKSPQNIEVISDATFIFTQLGDSENTNKYLSKLKKLDPSHPDIPVFEGIIAQKRGNLKRTIELFEKALKLNPDKVFIINYLINYYNENSQWENLNNLYEIALQNNPNNSNFQEAYGTFLWSCPNKELRDLRKAKEYSERAYINKTYTIPTKLEAGKSLSVSHFQLGNHGKALYYIHQTIDFAKKVKANGNYILELENISNDFRNIMASNNP